MFYEDHFDALLYALDVVCLSPKVKNCFQDLRFCDIKVNFLNVSRGRKRGATYQKEQQCTYDALEKRSIQSGVQIQDDDMKGLMCLPCVRPHTSSRLRILSADLLLPLC